MIYTFAKTTKWIESHEVKQDVLLKVGEIIERHGAQIGYPMRTLHVPEALQGGVMAAEAEVAATARGAA